MKIDEILESYSRVFKDTAMRDTNDLTAINQALYRLFASFNNEWKVLHASGISIEGRGLLFGDDGTSIGKTTQSLYLYKVLKDKGKDVKYIADEFVLYHKGFLYPNKYIPLHVRPGSKEYIERVYGPFEEGHFKLPESSFADNPIRLHAMVCTHPKPGTFDVARLYGEKALNAWKCTAYAHVAKLHNPRLDRFSVFSSKNSGISDSTEIKDVRDAVKMYPDFCPDAPVYRVELGDPEDIVRAVEENCLMFKKTPLNQVSAGVVLFNPDGTEMYINYDKERSEWKLLKKRVEGEAEWTEVALESVKEQAGFLNLELIDPLPLSSDVYEWESSDLPKNYHRKEVHYYVVRLRDFDSDGKGHNTGAWFPIKRGIDRLSFRNERNIVKKVIKAIADS